MEQETPTNRRGFLAGMTIALGSVPVLGGLIVALRTALAPAHSERPDRFPLCKVTEVPDDDILERSVSFRMRLGPRVEDFTRVVFVTRDPDSGQILAMSGECTHLTCPVQKRDVVKLKGDDVAPLACPCHGGRFSRTGEVLDGPPPRPLRRLRIQLPDGDPDGMIWLLEV
jgi:Rieske Fe-S protein